MYKWKRGMKRNQDERLPILRESYGLFYIFFIAATVTTAGIKEESCQWKWQNKLERTREIRRAFETRPYSAMTSSLRVSIPEKNFKRMDIPLLLSSG